MLNGLILIAAVNTYSIMAECNGPIIDAYCPQSPLAQNSRRRDAMKKNNETQNEVKEDNRRRKEEAYKLRTMGERLRLKAISGFLGGDK